MLVYQRKINSTHLPLRSVRRSTAVPRESLGWAPCRSCLNTHKSTGQSSVARKKNKCRLGGILHFQTHPCSVFFNEGMFRESEPLLGWHVVAPQKGNTNSADRWVIPVLTGHNPAIVVDSQSHFHSLRHSLRIGCSFLFLNVAYIPTHLICPGPCSVIPQVAVFAVGHIWATFHHFHQFPGLSWRMIFYPNLLQLLVVYTCVLVAFVMFSCSLLRS